MAPGSDGRPDWQPVAPLENLRRRARLLQRIRAFFAERGVMEVETPALSRAAITDPHLQSFAARYSGPGHAAGLPLYLHTSPEFPMKRLLAAGAGPIYQLCKVFRQGEAGRRHNPEFTLLEWYRPGYDHHALMDEVEALAASVLGLAERAERISYREAFRRYLNIDPLESPLDALRAAARDHGIRGFDAEEQRDLWLDLLLSHCIEPELGREGLCFLYDYPASQAALARLNPEDPRLAERFELYYRGVELANGFHELADAGEQRRRFETERTARRKQGLEQVPLDEYLLAALEQLPDCSGVALGIDRLVMLALGADSLDEVMAFTIDNC
ncbi:MAG: EF-P lysine aminoacylase EpmA [Gammaproteobacteria bacterium]|nr:EF-P lysine aminoacylase EpmA [Gammaproteobacteria bacterium]MCW8841353.1 EF-P lysine aminoacylase EpmA [Gammaproteobacteria bacterium]MCW8927776.1 EF-P lysine aminoacylase EpmA [Gammaproteobacteria bacterium]MCW8959870.1 EF-P lysine aminoacylase EpmA [Gammaproteobacteria bacterium]MCW8973442.1 EF-P lysine aminoacylase EpmA [Gammaproteobacteria bacterium]